MKGIQNGKIKATMPDLNDWDSRLIQMFLMCCKDDGLNVSDLDILFKRMEIKNNNLFVETSIILNRVFHYTRE